MKLLRLNPKLLKFSSPIQKIYFNKNFYCYYFKLAFYLFIWLHWILVAALRIFVAAADSLVVPCSLSSYSAQT